MIFVVSFLHPCSFLQWQVCSQCFIQNSHNFDNNSWELLSKTAIKNEYRSKIGKIVCYICRNKRPQLHPAFVQRYNRGNAQYLTCHLNT